MNIELKPKFKVITSAEGYVITTYKETEDIKGYSSFTIAYAPLNADLSDYREITIAEDEAYMEAMEKAIKEEELNERA